MPHWKEHYKRNDVEVVKTGSDPGLTQQTCYITPQLRNKVFQTSQFNESKFDPFLIILDNKYPVPVDWRTGDNKSMRGDTMLDSITLNWLQVDTYSKVGVCAHNCPVQTELTIKIPIEESALTPSVRKNIIEYIESTIWRDTNRIVEDSPTSSLLGRSSSQQPALSSLSSNQSVPILNPQRRKISIGNETFDAFLTSPTKESLFRLKQGATIRVVSDKHITNKGQIVAPELENQGRENQDSENQNIDSQTTQKKNQINTGSRCARTTKLKSTDAGFGRDIKAETEVTGKEIKQNDIITVIFRKPVVCSDCGGSGCGSCNSGAILETGQINVDLSVIEWEKAKETVDLDNELILEFPNKGELGAHVTEPGDLFIAIFTDKEFQSRVSANKGSYPDSPKEAFESIINSDSELPEGLKYLNDYVDEHNEMGRETDAVSYDDICGLDDELEKVRKKIELPLSDPDAFQGIDTSGGVLLWGPPGTGKTMIAKALKNEIDAWFEKVNCSDVFGPYIGESSNNIENLFKNAKQNSPAILFFDELDALANSSENSPQAQKNVLSMLKNELDGIDSSSDVIAIGATNHPKKIDDALLRPSRFGAERIEIPPPDDEGKRELFEQFAENIRFEDEYNFEAHSQEYIEQAIGFTGDDINNAFRKAKNSEIERLYSKYEDDLKISEIEEQHSKGINHLDMLSGIGETTPSVLASVDEDTASIEFPEVKWEDIKGLEEAKTRIKEEVYGPMKAPELFEDADGVTGILLYGPPGTGKTMIARALANQTNRIFLHTAGDELTEKWIGESSSNVKELFDIARQVSPSILFVDEIDALIRGRGTDSGTTAYDRVTTQFLTCMDGLKKEADIVVVGTTNKRKDIDSAALRPGRLGTQMKIGRPSRSGRREILEHYIDKYIHEKEQYRLAYNPVTDLIEETSRYTGADLDNLVKEAYKRARREYLDIEDLRDLDSNLSSNLVIPVKSKHFAKAVKESSPTESVTKDGHHPEG